jgi:hypothetical protein
MGLSARGDTQFNESVRVLTAPILHLRFRASSRIVLRGDFVSIAMYIDSSF